MTPTTQDFGPCPCEREIPDFPGPRREVNKWRNCIEGTKLTRYGHLVGCTCRSCLGRRNRAKGRKAQTKMHQRLGGEGWSPTHEEAARPYTVEVSIMPESKKGGQVPASFHKFIATEWFRRALDQSARAAPVGTGVLPAVVIDANWVIVDIRGREKP